MLHHRGLAAAEVGSGRLLAATWRWAGWSTYAWSTSGLAGNRLGMPWHGQRPAQRGRPGQTNGIDSSSSAGEASMGGVRRTRRRIGGVGVDLEEISLARKMNDDG